MLLKEYQVTLFFYNPNIHPEEEYVRRLKEVQGWSNKIGLELIEGEYNHQNWQEAIKGLEAEREGGKRCIICYSLRLEKIAELASKQGYNSFATTLTISPHKKAENINPIGQKLAEEYQLEFIARDWKKQDGYKHACELSKAEGFYRQSYCGCEYSVRTKEEGLRIITS